MKFKEAKINKSPRRAIELIEQIAKEMNGEGQVKVGLPANSNDYPDGTSVIMVGSVHEFGSPKRNIPERSYLRSALNDNRRRYKKQLSKLGRKIATGKLTSENALNLLGLIVQTDVRDRITDLKDPPLKYREGNPLLDTGHLRQSITYVVND